MDEIRHYGILGMKWGVRKQSINTKKDSFKLQKGATIHRATYNPKEENTGHAFVTFKSKDAKGYASRQRMLSGGKLTYDMAMKAKEVLVSPSKRERIDTFVNLMLTDPEFSKAHQAQKAVYQVFKNRDKQAEVEQNLKKLEREYAIFTVGLGGSEPLRQKYFSALSKKGYNMIIDDADAAVISNSPVIIFDRQKSLEVVRVSEVNREYLRQLGKGVEMLQGLIDGLKDTGPLAIATVVNLGEDMIAAFRLAINSNSPSKAFMEIGKDIDEGLVIGLKTYGYRVTDTTEGIGHNAIDTLKEAMSGIGDAVNGDIQPTIRPVLDLTNVTRGIGQMDNALLAQRSLALSAAINQNGNESMLADFAKSIETANTVSNNKIVSAIESLEERMSGLVNKIGKLQVVMDTGSLVGVITPDVNRSLGNMAVMNRRGI